MTNTDTQKGNYYIIADHLRTTIFALADGAVFEPKGRGYILRKLVKKATLLGYLLHLNQEYLQKIRAYAIDMETATIFTVGFYNKIPTGALLLVSDQPMIPEGVKTEDSDKQVTADFVERHLRIGIDSLKQLINGALTVRHLRF